MQFAVYSLYYDLLYQDKNYVAEAAYIHNVLKKYEIDSGSVLELGCGTGKHAALLATAGLHVTGVELSDTMLLRAADRASKIKVGPTSGSFRALPGDARTVRLEQQFDAVVSLFHVVSYQTTNPDVQQMFETASLHLRRGGVFVFDVWYGPAVVTMRPAVRVKRIEDSAISVLRIAEPDLDMNQNRVDVRYTVFVTDKASGRVEQFSEEHRMRYYFAPEVALLAEGAGLEIICTEEWMTASRPSESTWGVTFVARKN